MARGEGWSANKEQFKPYSHPYPQIIQAFDYETITAIEALFTAIKTLGGSSAAWTLTQDELRFERNGKNAVLRDTVDGVIIGDQEFKNQNTEVFFTTLRNALASVTDQPDCHEVRISQLKTAAYAHRTIIEFGCLPDVLTIDSFSNGPTNSERLYILDLVKAEQSMEWRP